SHCIFPAEVFSLSRVRIPANDRRALLPPFGLLVGIEEAHQATLPVEQIHAVGMVRTVVKGGEREQFFAGEEISAAGPLLVNEVPRAVIKPCIPTRREPRRPGWWR